MTKNKRMTNERRREYILKGAIKLIKREGISSLSRINVAKECGVSEGMPSFAYGTMGELRNAVYQYAIDNHEDKDMLRVLAAGLVAGNDVAKSAPYDVKQAAFALMM